MVKHIVILFFTLNGFATLAQDGKLVLNGLVTKEGQPLGDGEIKIFKADGGLKYSYANNVGRFTASLDLNTEYIVSASEKGYATRTITVLTEVPDNAKGGNYKEDVMLDLQRMRTTYRGKRVREENGGGVMFNKGAGAFVTVTRDISRIKEDMAAAEAAKKRREELRRKAMTELRAKERLDSIARARERFIADSIANWERRQDSLLVAKEQNRLDSIAAVKAHLAKIKEQRARERQQNLEDEATKLEALKLAEQERKRKEALELAAAGKASQARLDSIANAKLLAKQREQARADSINAAREAQKLAIKLQKEADKARRQAVTDSITAAKAAERQAEEDARLAAITKRNAELDSIAEAKKQAELAGQARLDSLAAAREAARLERLRLQEEADRMEKARFDSISAAKEAAKEAEITRMREQRKENTLAVTVVEDESKVTTITIADIYGTKTTFQKIAHSWGETFYYKNMAIISEPLYKTELENARNEVNPENIINRDGN